MSSVYYTLLVASHYHCNLFSFAAINMLILFSNLTMAQLDNEPMVTSTSKYYSTKQCEPLAQPCPILVSLDCFLLSLVL